MSHSCIFQLFFSSLLAAAFCQINWPRCHMSYFLSQLSRAANTSCTMKWNTFWSSFCKLMQCLLKQNILVFLLTCETKSLKSVRLKLKNSVNNKKSQFNIQKLFQNVKFWKKHTNEQKLLTFGPKNSFLDDAYQIWINSTKTLWRIKNIEEF